MVWVCAKVCRNDKEIEWGIHGENKENTHDTKNTTPETRRWTDQSTLEIPPQKLMCCQTEGLYVYFNVPERQGDFIRRIKSTREKTKKTKIL